jgi:predicted transcriptional regulator
MSDLKETAIKAIQSLPDDANLDRILEEIVYYAKVEEGLRDIREGRVVDLETVKAEFGIRE